MNTSHPKAGILMSSVLALLFTLTGQAAFLTQNDSLFRIVEIAPYDKAVPGQIMELRVEGLGGEQPAMLLSSEDFQIEISQDGAQHQANARTVTPIITRETRSNTGTASISSVNTAVEMHAFQNITFVVPQGLHVGEAEITLSYRGQHSKPVKLTIVDRPLRPVIGSVGVMTINPASLPPPPQKGAPLKDLGWRLERATKADLYLKPLV